MYGAKEEKNIKEREESQSIFYGSNNRCHGTFHSQSFKFIDRTVRMHKDHSRKSFIKLRNNYKYVKSNMKDIDLNVLKGITRINV